MPDTVLVTGGTGFIAQHCILELLSAGYLVRTTVRSPDKAAMVRCVIAANVDEPARRELDHLLDVKIADLLVDEGWRDAAYGCRYVMHVASPLPLTMPKDELAVISPALDGTLRVLQAAYEQGAERVVLTSSIAAIGYGRERSGVFSELDWSDLTSTRIDAYAKSKTLAERAAWEYVDSLPRERHMGLVAINPGLVLGPLLSKDCGASGEAVKKLLEHSVPGVPDLMFPPVDVRDVAAMHLAAMTSPLADGQRYICANESVPLHEIATILKRHYSALGYKVPTRRIPKLALRIAALFDSDLRLIVSEVGQPFRIDNQKIRTHLQFNPRGLTEMTLAMADSMIRFGVVKRTPSKWHFKSALSQGSSEK